MNTTLAAQIWSRAACESERQRDADVAPLVLDLYVIYCDCLLMRSPYKFNKLMSKLIAGSVFGVSALQQQSDISLMEH